MTQHFSRRGLLTAGGALAAAATGGLLTGCGDPSEAGGRQTKAKSGKIVWWDQYLPKEELEREFFAKFHQAGGPEVDYTVYNPNEQGKALQLAKQSDQLPDVFTLAGLDTAAVSLQEGGWFQPLGNADEITANLPEGTLIEGMHLFDGELYSFPLGTPRNYPTLPWGNKEFLKQADIEVTEGPQSWDDFRTKVRTSASAVDKPGLILPLAFAPRMASFVHDLAQQAGFDGDGGIEYSTGAYNYHHQAYLDAIDFLLSFQRDKLLLPASTGLDAREGRARWVAEDAVWFMDGSFNAGVVKSDFDSFMDKLAVTQLPTPDGAEPVVTHGLEGGSLWISASSPYGKECSELLLTFTTEEFQIGQAEAMDAGPINLDVVPDSDAHQTFKTCCSWFEKNGRIAPSPIARNPEIAKVVAKTQEVRPDLGTIIQGVFSGDVDDLPAALKKLSDDSEQARELAIQKAGAKVDGSAWAFRDWVRGEDYPV